MKPADASVAAAPLFLALGRPLGAVAGLALDLLFDRTKGILTFLDRAPGAKELEDAKTILLELLTRLVEQHSTLLQPHMKDVKARPGRGAWTVYPTRRGGGLTCACAPYPACAATAGLCGDVWPRAREQGARRRGGATHCHPLHLPQPARQRALRRAGAVPPVRPAPGARPAPCPGRRRGRDLTVRPASPGRSSLRFYDEIILQESKLTASLKAVLLPLLGTIARYFPSAVASTEEQLVRLLVRLADQELIKNKRKPELPLAAGALVGLQHTLHSYPELGSEGAPPSPLACGIEAALTRRQWIGAGLGGVGWIGPDVKYGPQVFELIKVALVLPREIHRYDVPKGRACVRLTETDGRI